MRTATGSVEVDPTGKKAGRGAYLCDAPGCWHAAGLRQRLGSALNTTVSDDDFRSLEQYADEFAPLA